MNDFAEQLPAIVAEAAKSPLGLFALMIISLSILGFYFFRQASERTRVGIFVMLFSGVAAFGASIVRTTIGAEPGSEELTDEVSRISIDGSWTTSITCPWGVTVEEPLVLEAEGRQLFGTVSYLGIARGFRDGEIEGSQISFNIVLEEILAFDEAREYKTSYVGNVSDETIQFVMQDDRGYPPVRFEARRADGN